MATLLTNALLADIDPPRVEPGGLRIENGRIVARNSAADRGPSAPGDEVVDCGGALLLPGMVNGHTHLYSALAVGMPPPPVAPRNFFEVLRYVWWRLDQSLDAESIETSARIGAIEALRCGTTTLIDHHASPNCIAGSLDRVERGIAAAGLRGLLCYETTDRHGPAGRDAGLAENERYIRRAGAGGADGGAVAGRFAGLVGAHASFTLEDASLDALAAMAERTRAGVHIHVAEDPCDAADASRRGRALLDRLAGHGLLRPPSVFAHGTHLAPADVARVNESGLTMAHNARSNMNNAVGYAPVAAFRVPVMLGTDGIGGDLIAEARAAWFISRHQHAGLSPMDIVAMLAASARRASASLGVTLGKLEPGAAADLVLTDYVPFAPLHTLNLPGHLIFGVTSNHVRSVMIDGEWRLRDRLLRGGDEAAIRAAARPVAETLWRRMALLPV